MKPQDYILFYSGATGAMKTAGFAVSDSVDGSVPDETMVAVNDWLERNGVKLEDVPDAVTGISQFTAWLAFYEQPKLYVVRTLAVTIQTNGGSVTVTVEPISGDIPSVLASLNRDIRKQLGTNPETNPAHPANDKSGTSGTPDEYTEETWSVGSFSKEVKDGAIQIRAHGGRWGKFGVAIYPDELDGSGLKDWFASIPSGNVKPPFPCKATITLKNGKPRKVSALTGGN